MIFSIQSNKSNMREEAKDWISNLPESLIHHIHSFLDIKEGARTSVLSKKWNYLWTTVPTLKFDSYDNEIEKFMDFVDGTLHRRNSSNVDKFPLMCFRRLNESRVHSWVSALIRGNVKQLSLDLQQKNSLCIPLSLFTYELLTSLELTTRHDDYTFPKCVSFPRLKRLQISSFKFSYEHWNEEIFSSSPVLEELALTFCEFCMENFCICIPTLKLLEFESCTLQDCALKIHAPSLATFTYRSVAAKEYVLSSFLSLVEAVISFRSNTDGAKIGPLLRALAHVKCLTVNDLTLQALCSVYDLSNNLPTFHNVEKLIISDCVTTYEALIALFRAVPKLESLVFEKYCFQFLLQYTWDELEDSDEDDNDDAEENGEDDNDVESVESENNHNNEDNVDISGVAKCDRNDEEEDSDEDGDDSAGGNEDDGKDAMSVEGENSHDSEDEIDVSDIAKCDGNDEGENNYDNEDSWALSIATNECLFPHLKSVCIQEFVGNAAEMRCVKLILRNAKALQVMTFGCNDGDFRFLNSRSQKEFIVEIPSLPRASTGCVFKFYSRDEKSIIRLN